MYYHAVCTSPLGEIGLVCSESALVALWLPGQREFTGETVSEDHPVLNRSIRWLERYFSGQAPDPNELPLELHGSPFQKLCWELLLQIPYGTTTTYGAIARQIARERGVDHMSCRAVGGAVGHNPISLIVPCHRVMGSDGRLTGYGGGIERKVALLRLEGVEVNPDRP
jgi:methylated-DNA-[protein]-cysteine S-methyltransferase